MEDRIPVLEPRRPGALGSAATLLLLVCMLAGLFPAHASFAVYVGRDLTADGSVLLAGYGDEPSSHWIEIIPRARHDAGTTIEVGVTPQARLPGHRITIPQVRRTHKYLTVNYSSFAGFPAPLTNGGLNERHVAARDVWSPSRRELVAMTPPDQRGLHYSDLSRIVMERANSARHAVEIVGSLIARHGYASYGGNSHLFADRSEGWILIEMAGGQGLWVAERLGPAQVRVSRPGYIGAIPLDYENDPNYMGSSNLISFAVEQGWYTPDNKRTFNVNAVYGKQDGRLKEPIVRQLERRLGQQTSGITVGELIEVMRLPELTRDSAGYGQVAHLRRSVRNDLAVLWVAAATPIAAPFVPIHMGASEVPSEYKQHRYLTSSEASTFMDADFMGRESSRYAFRVYKRLFYLSCAHPSQFLPEVTQSLSALERATMQQMVHTETVAETLYAAGKKDHAQRYLTNQLRSRAQQALELAIALSESIEARTRLLFGIREPRAPTASGRIHCTQEFIDRYLDRSGDYRN